MQPFPEGRSRVALPLRYAPTTPVVVVGDDQGCLTLLSLKEEEVPAYSRQEQQDRLEKSCSSRACSPAAPLREFP